MLLAMPFCNFILHRIAIFVPSHPESPPWRNCPGRESYLRSELSELVSHHILRYRDIVVHLSVMHLELQADKVWQDGGGAGLCADWVDLHSWDDLGDWESVAG